jgi:glutathione-S-conjugate glycine hydrolase
VEVRARHLKLYLVRRGIALDIDSIPGEQLLFNAEARRAYFPLSAQFVTQENQGLFGIASLVMVLNALHIPAPESARLKPFSAFDQSNIAAGSSESIR